jgi:hypothetical protein
VFNEDAYCLTLSEELLENFTLSEIFELNDLKDEDVLSILIRGGHIGEPSVVIERFEGTSSNSETEFYTQEDA